MKAGWIVLGLAAGVGVLVLASSSTTVPRPAPPVPPAPTPPPAPLTGPVQERPFPTVISETMMRQIVQVAQRQLQDLGFHITMIDGISGPETQAAVRAFIVAHPQEVSVAERTYREYADKRQIAFLIDDVYRAHLNAGV